MLFKYQQFMNKYTLSKRINFSSSHMHWGGASKGIFKLVAVLTVHREGSREGKIVYGLGQSVLAGNMYVDKGLLKQLPYLFQVAGSINEQHIFRTLIPNQPTSRKIPKWMCHETGTGDTYGQPLFDKFYIDIRNEPATIVSKYDDIERFFQFNEFSAKVHIQYKAETIEMEFPINHINVKHENRMWQIETGPILFPILSESEVESLIFLPCFVHFNSLNLIDVFYDHPFGTRSSKMNNNGIIEDFACQTNIFVSAS